MKRFMMVMLLAVLAQPAVAEPSNLAPNTPIPGCDSGLEVAGYQSSWNELTVDLDNPTSQTQSGGLVVDFVMDGQLFRWWFGGIEVPAQTQWQVTIEFPSTLTVLDVNVCDNRPGGIVDAPDPVAQTTEQEERKKKED